jgi:bacillithiol biosynthesis cysteine-adding enzyme BshC
MRKGNEVAMAQVRELFGDYCHEFRRLREFFRYDPHDVTHAIGELRGTQQRYLNDDQIVELRGYNEKTGCSDETLKNIDKLAEGKTVTVVTGQQPGIFTGPLYTIYKTLTAIKLARYITEQLNVTAVPVFWNASEDHDFDEVRHIEIVNRDHQVVSLIYEPKADIEGKSIFDVPLESSLDFLVDLLERDTNESEYKSFFVDLLRNSRGRSYSLADWFSRQMHVLFGDYGLVILDAHLAPCRKLARAVIGREIKNPLRSSHLVNAAGERLREMGYHQQIVRKPGDVNFFLYAQGRRNKVRFKDETFVVEHLGLEYTQTELFDMLAEEPERFSPSVVLRPLVQDRILPTVAYVGGPGEIAYFAQMREAYSFFELVMPVIFPRARAVLLEPGVSKILERYGLRIEDVRSKRKELLEKIASQRPMRPIVQSCDDKLEAMQMVLDEFRHEVSDVEPTLVEPVDKLKRKIGYEMDKLRDKLIQTQRDDMGVIEQQVNKLKNHLFPEGKEQERLLNIYPYLCAHGIQLIPMLERKLDIFSFERQAIHV